MLFKDLKIGDKYEVIEIGHTNSLRVCTIYTFDGGDLDHYIIEKGNAYPLGTYNRIKEILHKDRICKPYSEYKKQPLLEILKKENESRDKIKMD